MITGTLQSTPTIQGTLTIPTIAGVEKYTGSYTFTPSAEEQVIEIKNKRATQNITISAIPNNYGLVTWDGSTLTIS